ncbi:MAG: sulfatase-like hydrolase/transferase, partial [Verrucomicrobiota bacterium]
DARTALDPYLSPREFTLPKALDANPQLGFRHAHVGKWHLSGSPADPQAIGGWGHFSGFLGGERESYFDWEKIVDGVVQPHTTRYATSDCVTDALRWMGAQGTNRWFLWLAPKSAHSPLHVPPAGLHSYRGLPDPPPASGAGAKLYYQAMIEALDTELGRLLSQVNLANTLVLFLADNGTPTETIQAPFATHQCKGTLFEGGIRLPLFMAGAGLVATNRWVDAVVHAVDVPATLLEMAGVDLAATLPPGRPFDGRSFAALLRNQPWNPTESTILAENFGSIIPEPLRGVAARDARYKVLRLDHGREAFFDLQADPLERTNLLGNPASLTLPQRTAYAGLTNRLAGWHNPPQAPVITRVEAGPAGLEASAPEQLGAAYALERSPTLDPPAWTVVPGFEREVLLAEPWVRLRDPAPADPAFYRVTATGR